MWLSIQKGGQKQQQLATATLQLKALQHHSVSHETTDRGSLGGASIGEPCAQITQTSMQKQNSDGFIVLHLTSTFCN